MGLLLQGHPTIILQLGSISDEGQKTFPFHTQALEVTRTEVSFGILTGKQVLAVAQNLHRSFPILDGQSPLQVTLAILKAKCLPADHGQSGFGNGDGLKAVTASQIGKVINQLIQGICLILQGNRDRETFASGKE